MEEASKYAIRGGRIFEKNIEIGGYDQANGVFSDKQGRLIARAKGYYVLLFSKVEECEKEVSGSTFESLTRQSITLKGRFFMRFDSRADMERAGEYFEYVSDGNRAVDPDKDKLYQKE